MTYLRSDYSPAEFVQNILNRDKSGWSSGCSSGLHGNIGCCECGVPVPGLKAKLIARFVPMKLFKWKLKATKVTYP